MADEKTVLLVAVVLVAGAGAVFTVGAMVANDAGPQEATLADVEANTNEYVGQEVTVEGWYEGGTFRDKNPVCSTGRDGAPTESYSWIFMSTSGVQDLYIGQKYRVTGVMTNSTELERSVVGDAPILVPESVEPIDAGEGGC